MVLFSAALLIKEDFSQSLEEPICLIYAGTSLDDSPYMYLQLIDDSFPQLIHNLQCT